MIAIIVAKGKNDAIGKDNELLWHIPQDLVFFKEKTLGKTILMGRKTFESLPRVLPKRDHWVITKEAAQWTQKEKYQGLAEEVRFFGTVEEAKKEALAKSHQGETVFIIGGAQIYKAFMEWADRLYITEVDVAIKGDVYFPVISEETFAKVAESEAYEIALEGQPEPVSYRFVTYDRVSTKE